MSPKQISQQTRNATPPMLIAENICSDAGKNIDDCVNIVD
jgi:hypothetical protein